MRLTKKILLLGCLLLPVPGAWAVDADNDGSDSYEEGLAGTSDNDPTQRPYWWKTVNGDSENGAFGASASDAGDVNGDGYADLIVGASWVDAYGQDFGSARVISGADGSILHTFTGDSAWGDFGTSVSGAGDVNGDGYSDLIVGARNDDDNGAESGSARVFSGANGSILRTFSGDSAGDQFGYSVSDAGDVNGDGFADLIVGAPRDDHYPYVSRTGSARVISGANGSLLYTFHGQSTDDRFGLSVSGAGDVNGDSFADLIVGASGVDTNGPNSGSARVFSGENGALLYIFNGDSAYDAFGQSVSGAGDVNADGYADLIVGAYLDSNNGLASGSAQVFSGANGALLYTFNGDSEEDYLGVSVSGAGDVNGDGYADLVVGAYGDTDALDSFARVFSGANGALLYTFNGDSVGDGLGISVSGAGDVNGDGYADLVVGATGDDNSGTESGSARIILSSDLMNDTDLDYHLNNTTDNCPSIANSDQADGDLDGVGDLCDNCPANSNPSQADADGDGIGNKCDSDYVTPGC